MGITGTVVEDTGRQEFLAGIGQDAIYIADEMKRYAAVCKAADKAIKARDDFFMEKLRVPAFADRVDRVRDWAAAKRDGDVLTINGKKYTSVKEIFKKEWGVSYEHVRQCCEKLKRLRGLVDGECDTPTQPTTNPTATPTATVTPTQPTTKPTAAPTATPTTTPTATGTSTTPAMELLSVNGRDPKLTMTMMVDSAFDFAVSFTGQMTTEEIDEFYVKLLARLRDELARQNGQAPKKQGSGDRK
jgi:hypothetical protein